MKKNFLLEWNESTSSYVQQWRLKNNASTLECEKKQKKLKKSEEMEDGSLKKISDSPSEPPAHQKV